MTHIRFFPVLLLLTLLLPRPARAQTSYRAQAEAQTDWIQAHYYDAAAAKYHDTFPVKPHGLPWTVMWANGVQWRVLVEAAQAEPAKYRPVLDAFGRSLNEYWDPTWPVPAFNAYCSGPGGTDKYYDDNAWMVLGYLEAYHATHDPQYLQRARETQRFVLSGWDDKLGGGIYWSVKHNGKNTCVNAPAAVSALRLSAVDSDPAQKEWANKIIAWTDANLRDTDGLFWDNKKLDGTIGTYKWTYNTGLMIQANVLLFQQNGDKAALHEAEREADAGIAAWQDPATGAFHDNAGFTHLLCEGLLRLYQADHNMAYLNAVRRHAAFGTRVVRDPAGGYFNDWKTPQPHPDAPKTLLENASDARLLWLLAPYPDSAELYAQGIAAATRGNDHRAEDLLRQSADSDTQAVEAQYRLMRVLKREGRTAAANAEAQKLSALAADPALRARLEAIGWQAPAASAP